MPERADLNRPSSRVDGEKVASHIKTVDLDDFVPHDFVMIFLGDEITAEIKDEFEAKSKEVFVKKFEGQEFYLEESHFDLLTVNPFLLTIPKGAPIDPKLLGFCVQGIRCGWVKKIVGE